MWGSTWTDQLFAYQASSFWTACARVAATYRCRPAVEGRQRDISASPVVANMGGRQQGKEARDLLAHRTVSPHCPDRLGLAEQATAVRRVLEEVMIDN